MKGHYSYDDIPWEKREEGWEVAVVNLSRSETAWNPGSTKHPIYGPAIVAYERGPDGGVSAFVEN